MKQRPQPKPTYGQQLMQQVAQGYQLPKLVKPTAPVPRTTQLPIPPTAEGLTDEYGLATSVYARFPDAVRFYLNIGLEAYGLPKDKAPGLIGFGTVPELCMFGLLIDNGFRLAKFGFYGRNARSFLYQSDLLGGRMPGGAVADFVIYVNGLVIPVRVQSVFHDVNMPFGGGGRKEGEDELQRYMLNSQSFVTTTVDVNLGSMGYPLEKGNWVQVKREFRRATLQE